MFISVQGCLCVNSNAIPLFCINNPLSGPVHSINGNLYAQILDQVYEVLWSPQYQGEVLGSWKRGTVLWAGEVRRWYDQEQGTGAGGGGSW